MHAWAEVCYHTTPDVCPQGSTYGPLTQVLPVLAVLAEGSLTQASVQTPSQPLSGWMTKPALHVWRLGLPTDPGIQRAWIILHSFIHSFIHSDSYIHIYDRDLHQSFQVPRSIDNTTHTLVLRSHAQVHTPNGYSNSAILSNNFVSLPSDL